MYSISFCVPTSPSTQPTRQASNYLLLWLRLRKLKLGIISKHTQIRAKGLVGRLHILWGTWTTSPQQHSPSTRMSSYIFGGPGHKTIKLN